MKYELHIEEMMCQRCKAHIEKALSEVKGVKATVDLEAKKAYCECAEELDTETLTAAVKAAGYDVDYIKKI